MFIVCFGIYYSFILGWLDISRCSFFATTCPMIKATTILLQTTIREWKFIHNTHIWIFHAIVFLFPLYNLSYFCLCNETRVIALFRLIKFGWAACEGVLKMLSDRKKEKERVEVSGRVVNLKTWSRSGWRRKVDSDN